MQVLIDLKEVAAGSLFEDWDMLPPKVTTEPCQGGTRDSRVAQQHTADSGKQLWDRAQ